MAFNRFLCPWENMNAEAKSLLPGAMKDSLEQGGASLTGDQRHSVRFQY